MTHFKSIRFHRYIIVVSLLVVLGACAPVLTSNTATPPAPELSATLEMPAHLPDGNRIMIQFTLTNNSDADLYVLKWYTPLEGIGSEIFSVERDGQAVPYTGILAMRGDPTPEGYQLLEAGQSASAKVDLAASFDFSQPGEYTIEFLSPRISHVARSEAEMARSVDELGPIDIPANTVTVEIAGSTDEAAGTPTADDLVHYQGASPFYPDAQPFEIDYSPSLWEYVPGDAPNHVDRLEHRHIPGCMLWLGGGGLGASPVSTASLEGYEWTISQFRFDLLQYFSRWDRGVLIFDLRLPKRYKPDAKGPCQRSAEDVLRTIKVTGRPLPHSMKGYELYSWYEEDEGYWYYTLITGTNRLKTLEDVRARTNVVRPGGWVSIMVRGDGPLKTLLHRLPKGEQVTWVGPEWLKQVGADEEMVEAIKLPDRATITELETFCRELGVNLHTTATQAPTATLDDIASAETTPAPTEESANEQTFGELSPPPDGWERYTSTRWGVSFAVPAAWQEEEADHFVGEDGFARLERFGGPGLSVDQACEWEANFHRERYGPEPGLQSLAWENSIHTKGFPCLILGSLNDTSEFQSAILLTNPRKDHKSRFLILRVDTAHAETVARSLSYRLHVPPRPTSSGNSYLATPSPEEVPDDLPLQTSHYDELTLEEYAVIDASVDGPGHLEFFQRIPPAVLEKRRAWRDVEAIEPYLSPVEVGGERVAVKEIPYGKFQRQNSVGSSMYVSVQKDGTEVYRYNMLMHAGSSPLHYLGNWDGQWVLEANSMLIVDGKIVNQDWGYDEIFGAQLLNEKPFYFFAQDGETRAAYDGQVLPVAYNYVFHGMCCEPGVFNVAGNSQMVWFYALRAGVWHYVELGVYD